MSQWRLTLNGLVEQQNESEDEHLDDDDNAGHDSMQ